MKDIENTAFNNKPPLRGRFGGAGVSGSILLRNILNVLRRFKTATVLNILGLSVAFAAFILLMMQVSFEWRFDKFHKNADCLYRLGIYRPNTGNQVVLSRPLIDAFIASSPHIKKGALIQSWISESFFTIEQDGKRAGFKEPRCFAYPDFAEVFSFEMQEGERLATENPGMVIIPETMAYKLGNYIQSYSVKIC